jgi:putative ABC transport system permease protein
MEKTISNIMSQRSANGTWGAGLLFKTAFRSLIGNGLKIWLNVFVLSFTFVLIIFMQGLLDGWSYQAITDTKKWEIGEGEFWSKDYDPYNLFSLNSSAILIPQEMEADIHNHLLEPILIQQGSIAPNNRMQHLLLKGISPDQHLIALPTQFLKNNSSEIIPVIMGFSAARQAGMKVGDMERLTVIDSKGSLKSVKVKLVNIFKTSVPSVDGGQMWMSLENLQQLTGMEHKATKLTTSLTTKDKQFTNWSFKSVEILTKESTDMVKAKSKSTGVMSFVFLLLGLIAIFDTQTLSIFRRQREIGTFVALGMTPRQVMGMFTLEGTMNAVLAVIVGSIYGIPLCVYYAVKGIPLNMDSSQFGMVMADKMYPVFNSESILKVVVFIVIITAVISYFPARKIAKMKPTDAIRGKVS